MCGTWAVGRAPGAGGPSQAGRCHRLGHRQQSQRWETVGLGELARSLDSPKHSPRLVSWPSEACLGDWGPPGGRAFEQGQGHRQRGWVRSCTGSLLSPLARAPQGTWPRSGLHVEAVGAAWGLCEGGMWPRVCFGERRGRARLKAGGPRGQ